MAPAESRGAPECRGREEVRIRLNELLESRLVESFESLERDQQGFASTHALLSLVGGLSALPGRKAVLLFSEGLAIPSNVEATYRSVIGAANRARVSVYTVDAGGLRVESPADELRRALDTVKTRSRYDTDGGRLTEESLLGLHEKNEGAMRLAPESTLTPLADQTGGFALAGTNDLAEGLSRFEEELRSHYVLSYAPRNRDFDGRFRTIRVAVGRPHGRVQARKGYLALRTALPVPALPHEAAALARLDARSGPHDVPLRLRGLQFPQGEGASRVPILVEVPSGAFGFDRDEKARGLPPGVHHPRARPGRGRARGGQGERAVRALGTPRAPRGGASGRGALLPRAAPPCGSLRSRGRRPRRPLGPRGDVGGVARRPPGRAGAVAREQPHGGAARGEGGRGSEGASPGPSSTRTC